jgi:hypothetical protein
VEKELEMNTEFNWLRADIATSAAATDRVITGLLVAIEQLQQRITLLEGGQEDGDNFAERVLEVLDVRSGTARDKLWLGREGLEEAVIDIIEERSGTVYSAIEAEIEGKLEEFPDSYSFTQAVEEAVKSTVQEAVAEALDNLLHDAIIDAVGDAEDIVRKGLRQLL